MNTIETQEVQSIVENVFQGEECSFESLTAYITGNGTLFGICEESEDLDYLEKSYEQPQGKMV
jgi:hypothetical protein